MGGDTNGDGASSGFPGEWNGLWFTASSSGNLLDNVRVRYAGSPDFGVFCCASVRTSTSGLTVQNSIIEEGAGFGFYAQGSGPATPITPTLTATSVRNNLDAGVYLYYSVATLTGNTIADNANYAVVCADPDSSSSTIQGNIITGNANGIQVEGGSLTRSTAWSVDAPYVQEGVTVAQGVTLTLPPGATVKSTSNALQIDGTLMADGTAGLPITFTSYRDDSVGGDTNGDEASSGSPGEWDGLWFTASSSGNLLDNVRVRYAGSPVFGVFCCASVRTSTSGLTVQNSIIEEGAGFGFYAQGPGPATPITPTLTATAVRNNVDAGVYLYYSVATLTGNTISTNGPYGIYLSNSPATSISQSTISGHTAYGVFSDTPACAVFATGNYWGAPNGPLHVPAQNQVCGLSNPIATGDRVSDHVDYSSWLGNCPDLDLDGYCVISGDCDDRDSKIHPGASDLAGNGIDEDCSNGDAQALGSWEGYVFWDGRKEFAGAEVEAIPVSSSLPPIPCAITGEDGSYECTNMRIGQYRVRATYRAVSNYFGPTPTNPNVDPLTVEVGVRGVSKPSQVDIYFPRPMLFVRGWRGDEHTWDGAKAFLQPDPFTCQAPCSRRGYLFHEASTTKCGRIRESAESVKSMLQGMVAYYAGNSPGKFNIVGHSAGGLFSRAYLNLDTLPSVAVYKLAMLETPNSGIPETYRYLIDAFYTATITTCPLLGELSARSMDLAFNGRFLGSGGAQFGYWAGSRTLFSLRMLGPPALGPTWVYPGCPRECVGILCNYAVCRSHVTVCGPTELSDADHSSIARDLTVLTSVLGWLDSPSPRPHPEHIACSGFCQATGSCGATVTAAQVVQAVSEPTGRSAVRVDSLASPGIILLPLELGAVDEASFHVVWQGTDEIAFTLIDPTGAEITPETPSVDPSVRFDRVDINADLHLATYGISNTMARSIGSRPWQFKIAVDIVADPNGVGIRAFAEMVGGSTLTVDVTPPLATQGATVTLTASVLDDGRFLTSLSEVQAQVTDAQGTSSAIALLDDGNPPDVLAGDGIYSGPFLATSAGDHFLEAVAVGLDGTGEPFERAQGTMYQVSPSSATFGIVGEGVGVDTNANGFYDLLSFPVEINALAPGSYRITGILKATGRLEELTSSSTVIGSAGIGTLAATLSFDGPEIYRAGIDGPYVLSSLRLIDTNAGEVEVDSRQSAGNSGPLPFTAFESPDADGDGVPDLMDNCPGSWNPPQIDTDGDAAGDACDLDADGDGVPDPLDCAAVDASVLAMPSEVPDLRFMSTTQIEWDFLEDFSGTATKYDVFRGRITDLRDDLETRRAGCLATMVPVPTTLEDTALPPLRDAFYYLVRGVNSCGIGSLGSGSNGKERPVLSCSP